MSSSIKRTITQYSVLLECAVHLKLGMVSWNKNTDAQTRGVKYWTSKLFTPQVPFTLWKWHSLSSNIPLPVFTVLFCTCTYTKCLQWRPFTGFYQFVWFTAFLIKSSWTFTFSHKKSYWMCVMFVAWKMRLLSKKASNQFSSVTPFSLFFLQFSLSRFLSSLPPVSPPCPRS